MGFEPNVGQTDPEVRFVARGRGYALFLTASEAVLAVRGNGDVESVLRMRAVGGDPNAEITPLETISGRSNYFTGSEPSRWHTNIPNYGRVRYSGIYPGIDAEFHGRTGQLEYDFVVSPGADPGLIGLEFEGASGMEVDGRGDLVLESEHGNFRQQRPVVYQEEGGTRREVSGRYRLGPDRLVRFEVDDYDRSRALVIDPILSFSSLLGGASDDRARAVATDGGGGIYLTGETRSADFPVRNGPVTTLGNGDDVFVTRIATTATGSSIVSSTFLGGSNDDLGLGIAVDGPRTWVAGVTFSVDEVDGGGVPSARGFPTTPSALKTTRSGPAEADAFVTRLDTDASGSMSIGYSTLLGTPQQDAATSVALDPGGDVWVAGTTSSPVFPTTPGAAIASRSGTDQDGFVTRIDGRRSGDDSLVASTYLGGTAEDFATSVAVDGAGSVVVAGQTRSADFPVSSGAFAASIASADADAFLARLGPTATLSYATYLGGSSDDVANSVSTRDGRAYVAGQTFSDDLPVSPGALQPARAGSAAVRSSDAFVTVIDTGATGPAGLAYSTYLGGDTTSVSGDATGERLVPPPCRCSGTITGTPRGERATAVALAPDGAVVVTGETRAGDFPVAGMPFQATKPGAATDNEAFVARLRPEANGSGSLEYSSYLGGTAEDVGTGVSVRADTAEAVVVGYTASADFPLLEGAVMEQLDGGYDAFVSEVAVNGAPAPVVASISPGGGPTAGGTEVRITGSGLAGTTAVRFGPASATGLRVESETLVIVTSPPGAAGTVNVTVSAGVARSLLSPDSRFVYGDEGLLEATTPLTTVRFGHTATLLADGRVLVAGGHTGTERDSVRPAEIFDPTTAAWSSPGALKSRRSQHTATLLGDGRVLVTGGAASNGAELATSEIFDPAASSPDNAWSFTTSPMAQGRVGHTATPLNDGRVLVVGGTTRTKNSLASAEIYDPNTGAWSAAPSLPVSRYGHTATLLADGRVLVSGGATVTSRALTSTTLPSSSTSSTISGSPPTTIQIITETIPLGTAEIFDPTTATWSSSCSGSEDVCSRPGARPSPRYFHSATALRDGRVLVAGGSFSPGSPPTASAEIFHPDATDPTQAWKPAGRLVTARTAMASSALPGGRALVVGGEGATGPLATGEVFDPQQTTASSVGTWRSTAAMAAARGSGGVDFFLKGPTATLLSGSPSTFSVDPGRCGTRCGSVLIVGGSGTSDAELFTPSPTIESITPSSGPAEGGVTATIVGTGFTTTLPQVRFGPSSAPSSTVLSYFQLAAVVPAASTQTVVDVAVATASGTAVGRGMFTYTGLPAAVTDLRATASESEITLRFSAPGATAGVPPPVQRYIVRQTTGSLSTDSDFDSALALCNGLCVFSPAAVGDTITIAVDGLDPNTTYRYALRPVNESGGIGPRSNVAEATTGGAPAAAPDPQVATPTPAPAFTGSPGTQASLVPSPATTIGARRSVTTVPAARALTTTVTTRVARKAQAAALAPSATTGPRGTTTLVTRTDGPAGQRALAPLTPEALDPVGEKGSGRPTALVVFAVAFALINLGLVGAYLSRRLSTSSGVDTRQEM